MPMQKHIYPICGYEGLDEDPGPSPHFWGSQEICPSCGWQFGYNNPAQIERYRAEWVDTGAHWFLPEKRPARWSLTAQLAQIGLTVNEVRQAAQPV